MTNMTMGDAEYRRLLNRYISLSRSEQLTHSMRAALAQMNARLEAAELQDSRVCRIADVVDDYAEAVACGDMSGAEL